MKNTPLLQLSELTILTIFLVFTFHLVVQAEDVGWISQAKVLDDFGIFTDIENGYLLEETASITDVYSILSRLSKGNDIGIMSFSMTSEGYANDILKLLGYTETDFLDETALDYIKRVGYLQEGDYEKHLALGKLTRGGLVNLTYLMLFIPLKDDCGITFLEKLYLNDRIISEDAITKVASVNGRVAEVAQKLGLVSGMSEILSAKEIARRFSPAVFYLITYDEKRNPIQSGSGFFVSKDGIAVTNYHVLCGAYTARILTSNQKIYNVKGILSKDEENDLAVIQVDGADFPVVTYGNSAELQTGDRIYCISSPYGLSNTFTEGIVSNANRIIEGKKYIQMTAPIANGSSGGVVLNDHGETIGIATAILRAKDTLYFALPINLIHFMKNESLFNDFPR